MIAIILVGGKYLPNPLIPVAKEPFLYWLTLWLKSQGFSHIVYSAGQDAGLVEAFAQRMATFEPSLCLDVVTESRPLGTGGAAALCAQRFPYAYTLIVNGNSILLSDLQVAVQKLKQSTLDAIIFGVPVTNAGRFGTLEINHDHQLLAFREKQPGKGPINAGVYLLRNKLLEEINIDKNSSLEYDCFPQWIKEGKSIQVVNNHVPFIDIGTPETLKRAEELIIQYQRVIIGQQQLVA